MYALLIGLALGTLIGVSVYEYRRQRADWANLALALEKLICARRERVC